MFGRIYDGKVIVMFPTRREAGPFMERYGKMFFTAMAGIGQTECAARTAKIIIEQNPGVIILAGIAGAIPGREPHIRKGDTVLVVRENLADLGTLSGDGFAPLPKSGGGPAENHYDCLFPLPGIFPKVVSNTVNTAGTVYAASHTDAAIENMEGAGFFAVCNALGVPCVQIRTVSNYVGEPREEWIVGQAVESLAENVALLAAEIARRA